MSSSLDEQLAKEARKAGIYSQSLYLVRKWYAFFRFSLFVLKGFALASWPASAEKQRIVEEVASLLKVSVNIDTSSSERSDLYFLFL